MALRKVPELNYPYQLVIKMNKIIQNPIKVILVEDEKKSLLTLSKLLATYCPDIEIVGTAGTVSEGLEVIPRQNPDLIFMDIAMPDGDAFDLLNRLDVIDFEVVFITAYNDYALKAFDFSALHYLLKPINHSDLIEAVQRFEKTRADSRITERIQILNQSLQNNYLKISLPTTDGLIILEIDKIVRIEADSNYCQFYLIDKSSVVVSRSMNYFENILSELNFFRVHNTHLVNLSYVTKYQKGRGGLLTLSDGSQISVSASRKKDFLLQLNRGIVKIK
jgi:two-component system LytT family response regulator